MDAQQKSSLQHLASLTDVGRLSPDESSECWYEIGGTDNGIQLLQRGVTDSDMKHFASLPEWHFISLRWNDVSDKGFRHLSGNNQLRSLDIGETNITSLNPIKDATHLEQLWCDRLKSLTDRKAAALQHFCKLTFLDLSYADIGDATLRRLGHMKELRKLNLTRTKITNDGLRFISALPSLEALSLLGTAISDEGLKHLHDMARLRLLIIGDTAVTDKAQKSIKKAIPELEVAPQPQRDLLTHHRWLICCTGAADPVVF